MSINRRGLGMGLSALLGDSVEKDISLKGKQIIKIDLSDIIANNNQPRKNFKEESIKDLAKSIEENGLIQPIIVTRSDDGKYMIIAGERRFRATKLIGNSEIEAIVIDIKTVDEILRKALIENIQREDLNPIEEALAYKSILDSSSITHQDLADKIGKSRSHISNMIRILTLPNEILRSVEDGSVSVGHAKLLVSIQNPSEYLSKIKNGISVRELESDISIQKRGSKVSVKKGINSKKSISNEDDLDKDRLYTMIKDIYSTSFSEDNSITDEEKDVIENIRSLEEYIKERFDIKLSLFVNPNKSGYIKIDYNDFDELEYIVDKLF